MHQDRGKLLGFRILTPETAKRATLQEDGGTDTRTVMGGETLDIEDDPFLFFGHTPAHSFSIFQSHHMIIRNGGGCYSL
jgi:hypothetical protein